jgi:hypothetical protein
MVILSRRRVSRLSGRPVYCVELFELAEIDEV